MKEAAISSDRGPLGAASFAACLATILELPLEEVPRPRRDEDPAVGWTTSRWLGGLGLGIVPIADPATFSWPGPWIARVRPPDATEGRCVVMFGVPSGVVWDPARPGPARPDPDRWDPARPDPARPVPAPPAEGGVEGDLIHSEWIEEGFLIAAADIALARPAPAPAPGGPGRLEGIFVSGSAGEPTRSLSGVRALADRGLEGDRHVVGTGTFPSGLPGSALTLIEAEVCESFDPPLTPEEHRRNIVTRGIDLNALVGKEFTIGRVRCRGMRLCEPCTVVDRYATRPVLRALVHRGGLRADILEDGEVAVGDVIRVSAA